MAGNVYLSNQVCGDRTNKGIRVGACVCGADPYIVEIHQQAAACRSCDLNKEFGFIDFTREVEVVGWVFDQDSSPDRFLKHLNPQNEVSHSFMRSGERQKIGVIASLVSGKRRMFRNLIWLVASDQLLQR